MTRKRYAAIDIGTMTCRLLIADADENGLYELERRHAITNLGEGVDARGLLKPDAMQRVSSQIDCFLERIDSYKEGGKKTIEVRAVATSATRDAQNSSELLALLAQKGVKPVVLSGEQEAALSFKGTSLDFPGENLLLVDVGGGSTECTAASVGGKFCLSRSINVGCRRVSDRFFRSDPPNSSELEAARAWIHAGIASFFEELTSRTFQVDRMVAVAGTATSLVSVDEAMEVYDSTRVHRSLVSRETLDAVFKRLSELTLEQRKQVVGLEPERAPVIVAGLLILGVVMDLSGEPSFTVSESDILQGIILDAITK